MVLKIKFEKVDIDCLGQCSQFELKSLVSDEFMLFCLYLSYHIQTSLRTEFHASLSTVNPHC